MIPPAIGVPDYRRRLAAVRDAFPAAGIDALIVSHPPNLRYLAGFDGSMGALVVFEERCTLVVDGRYVTSARARMARHQDLRDVRIVLVDRGFEEAIAAAIAEGPPLDHVGVESAVVTLHQFDRLRSALDVAFQGRTRRVPELRQTHRLVERGRSIKDAVEVAILRTAAQMLSTAAAEVLTLVRPGRRERDIAADVDSVLRRAGFERSAFETIVASGPNSALPHARPGDRVLGPSDMVVLDFGGVYNGYCVDLTRTVQLPPTTGGFRELFAAVRAAHAAAIEAVRPGVRASEVDAAARAVLADRGLDRAFLHGTGHGLGLDVHEEPRIGKADSAHPDESLLPGMVFTIEPGAYLPAIGGVRLEDDVLVTEEGCEVLTNVPIDSSGVEDGGWISTT